MEYVYIVFKGLIDPVLIVILLLLIAFFICLIGGKKKSGALLLFLTIILLYGASIFPVSNYLCYYLEKDYIKGQVNPQRIDVIVVLGGGAHDINALNNTFPSEVTSTRLLHAVDVYNEKGAKYFVCTGKGSGKISEAELMAGLAQRLGVPKEKIRIEAKAINTWANAAELNKMFADKKIIIGLVTSASHLKRAEREFKKYFNNVVPFPANYYYSSAAENTFVKYAPQIYSLYYTSISLKEIVGQLWYSVKSIAQ
jgi:uncharacterized SAM-binding protein YcdF (DUF218 family)